VCQDRLHHPSNLPYTIHHPPQNCQLASAADDIVANFCLGNYAEVFPPLSTPPPLFDGKLVGLINGLATRTEQLEIRLEAMSAGHSPQVSLAIIQGRGAVGQ